MKNHVEELWDSFRKVECPTADGDHLRSLKIAFMQGMHSGQEFICQAASLPNRELVQFVSSTQQQITASLRELKRAPGRINIGLMPITKPITINGEKI